MYSMKKKLRASFFMMRKKAIIQFFAPISFAVVFFIVFAVCLFEMTAAGIVPVFSPSVLTQSFTPERLLSVSLPSKNSGMSLSEETVPEWIMYDEKYDELFTPEPGDSTDVPEGSFPVVATTLKTPSWMSSYEGVSVNNDGEKDYDLKQIVAQMPDIALEDTDEPQVLIVHTHGTESYNDENLDYYTTSDSFRSEENEKNMISIGNIVADSLDKAGYKVVHDKTQHDNPNFNTSYTSSNQSIKKYLEKYPTIKVVLDVHRDTIITDKGVKYRPVVDINGQQSAQVMILLGAGNPTYVNEHWKDNLEFAAQIQKSAAAKYPNLMRPILLRNSRYNQHLSNGGILVEVGSCGNTHEEAAIAAKYFTECLIDVLNKLK